jgi:phosphoglycolate phosphatase-like HAD superfamily hydrolase
MSLSTKIFGSKVLIFDFDGVIADTHQLHKDFLGQYISAQRIEQELTKSCTETHPTRWYPLRRQIEKVFYYWLYRYVKKYKKPLLYSEVLAAVSKNTTNTKFLMSMGSKLYMKTILGKANMALFNGVYGRFQIKSDKAYGAHKIMKKYKIDRKNVVFITDTVEDVLNLRSHEDIEIYAVEWGYCSRKNLLKVLDDEHILTLEQFVAAMK